VERNKKHGRSIYFTCYRYTNESPSVVCYKNHSERVVMYLFKTAPITPLKLSLEAQVKIFELNILGYNSRSLWNSYTTETLLVYHPALSTSTYV